MTTEEPEGESPSHWDAEATIMSETTFSREESQSCLRREDGSRPVEEGPFSAPLLSNMHPDCTFLVSFMVVASLLAGMLTDKSVVAQFFFFLPNALVMVAAWKIHKAFLVILFLEAIVLLQFDIVATILLVISPAIVVVRILQAQHKWFLEHRNSPWVEPLDRIFPYILWALLILLLVGTIVMFFLVIMHLGEGDAELFWVPVLTIVYNGFSSIWWFWRYEAAPTDLY